MTEDIQRRVVHELGWPMGWVGSGSWIFIFSGLG